MNNYELGSIEFCQELYGGTYSEKGDLLFLNIGKDLFRINLTDRERFGKYAIYHQSSALRLDNKPAFHKQCESLTFDYALFICFTHDFNKSNQLYNKKEDFTRFKEDLKKYHIWKQGLLTGKKL